MSAPNHLHLLPPLLEAGQKDELAKAGQMLAVSQSPKGNSLAVFVSNNQGSSKRSTSINEEQPIYFTCRDEVPSEVRRLFITDTLVIFTHLQNLYKSQNIDDPLWLQDEENFTKVRKLSIDYVNFIRECWVFASQNMTEAENASSKFNVNHYRSLYTVFALFIVLHIAEPGYEDAPVGEDLMEWLNTHFIEPSTEEGDHLSSLDNPWEDEGFWPYLTRATLRGLSKASCFFLGALSRHPSEDLQHLSSVLSPLVESQPRLQSFAAERDFALAFRRWRDKVKALRIEMDTVPEHSRFDEFENWWDQLSDIVGILEGREEVVLRVCEELDGDWKEACAAWGVFIDPHMRRQQLPDVVSDIMHELPPDRSNEEDQIHSALFLGQSGDVLLHASNLDPWLSGHLADLMRPLSLVDDNISPETGLSSRNHYILNYAEHLHCDSALWRITVDYMFTCGTIGQEWADEVLLRVPLRLHEHSDEKEENYRSGDVTGVLRDINETCAVYRRESVRRTVCRIAAQTFIREKSYGLAVSYSVSAEDWPGLGRTVDCVLEEYINSGPSAFSKYASEVAPSLQDLAHQTQYRGVFIHRLMFAVRYAHFHHLRELDQRHEAVSELVTLLHDEIAPRSWWAVLLADATHFLQGPELLFSSQDASELLRKLDDILLLASQGTGSEYFGILSRTKKSQREAVTCLKGVRISLAKYFALVFHEYSIL